MHRFDKRLVALTACTVLEGKGGSMVYDPFPVAVAEDDQVLAHELCHVLAGRRDYKLFKTACLARSNPVFTYILNILYDWYHEYNHGHYSGVLWQTLTELHKRGAYQPTGVPVFDDLWKLYEQRTARPATSFPGLESTVDLLAIADRMCPLAKQQMEMVGLGVGQLDGLSRDGVGGPGQDLGTLPKESDYYARAVAKYRPTIEVLSTLWKANKYVWQNNYYGEINWGNLPMAYLGQLLQLAVWRTLSKCRVERSVYLVIDRSGSTVEIKEVIMDTAVIIAESLRQLAVPISILDVGVTDSMVVGINETLDLSWFTPMAEGGTPLGEVCSLIKRADPDSYLLIITDGCPYSWDKLTAALGAFPGSNLTLVIDQQGNTFEEYAKRVKNVIRVEPHTIIRELLNDQSLRRVNRLLPNRRLPLSHQAAAPRLGGGRSFHQLP